MSDNDKNTFIFLKNPSIRFNKYLPPREIKKIDDLPPKKKEIMDIILEDEDFKSADKVRDQIRIMYKMSRDYAASKNDKEFKLNQDDLATLLGLSVIQIKNHCRKIKLVESNKIRSDGRPFSLTNQQIFQFSSWLDGWKVPPRVMEAKTYIYNNFHTSIQHTTFQTLLEKLGYEIRKVDPMEEKRYTVQFDRVQYHYQSLEGICLANNIPSAFVINFDEEGHDPYEDSKSEKVVSPKQSRYTPYYPVPRKGDRSTFLGCITGDGRFIKPLIITKRKTFTDRLINLGITPDNIMLETSQTGYITTELFNEWLDQEFVPYIASRREELNYNGVGIVICDGFSSHITQHFFEVCYDLNMEIFFLPSHSSHITQPLDLGIFASHKHFAKLPTQNDDNDDDQMAETISRIYQGWQQAATTANIISSWKQAGAIYDFGGVSFNIMRFTMLKVRSLNLIPDSPSDAGERIQKQNLSFNVTCLPEKRNKSKRRSQNIDPNNDSQNVNKNPNTDLVSKTRIPVKSFNTKEFRNTVANMKRAPYEMPKNLTLTQRLLISLMSLEHCEMMSEDKIDVNQKGRTRKQPNEETSEYNEDQKAQYLNLSYDERLELELKSLALTPLNETETSEAVDNNDQSSL